MIDHCFCAIIVIVFIFNANIVSIFVASAIGVFVIDTVIIVLCLAGTCVFIFVN